MFAVDTPRVKSRASLRIFCAESPDISARLANIKLNELAYLVDRDPTAVTPVGLSAKGSGYLKDRYESPTKKHKTTWIEDLRKKHKLTSCPMCGGSGVTTLDHFLPKEVYPEFSCFPYNLVPSCSHCNHKRGTKSAFTAVGLGFIHPYFDRAILNSLVLRCIFVPPYDAVECRWVIEAGVAGPDWHRVQSHLEASVNPDFFREAMNANWRRWHSKARRVGDRVTLANSASNDLKDNLSNGRNCWDAMFLRGIKDDHGVLDWMIANPNN